MFLWLTQFINRKFLLRSIISLVNSPTSVIYREFCRLLLGILLTPSKIPANLQISLEIKLLILLKNRYLSTLFSSSLKSQLTLPLRLRRRDSEKMLHWDKELLCLWRILFICSLFPSKPRNLHTTAPTINRLLVQLWVRPSLLPIW